MTRFPPNVEQISVKQSFRHGLLCAGMMYLSGSRCAKRIAAIWPPFSFVLNPRKSQLPGIMNDLFSPYPSWCWRAPRLRSLSIGYELFDK
jgi:hypothetical protein